MQLAEDAVGAFGLTACDEISTNDDPALCEAYLFANLGHLIPTRVLYGRNNVLLCLVQAANRCGSPATMKRSGILGRCSRLFGLRRSLPSNQSRSQRGLPFSQVLEYGMHIEVELSCELLADLPDFRNDRVFRHRITLPSIPQACRSPAYRTLLGCTQLQPAG